MKKIVIVLLFVAFIVPAIFAQTGLKGVSLNGATGLYSIPTGRIGWERESDFGLDFGYHFTVDNNEKAAHIPTLTMSLFKWLEISTAFDIQPDFSVWKQEPGKAPYREKESNDDLHFGFKLQFPTTVNNAKNPAVALGANIQLINFTDDDKYTQPRLTYSYTAYQIYFVTTYAGTFFSMPAETTVMVGKTFYTSGPKNNTDIDFGMGFDLLLFPDVFGSWVHWIIDFANFDYSDNSWPNSGYFHTGASWYRGILNTGLRFDLSIIPPFKKVKFVVDVILRDFSDAGNRSFAVGAVFGIPIL